MQLNTPDTTTTLRQQITGVITSCGWQVVGGRTSAGGALTVRAKRGRWTVVVESPSASISLAAIQARQRDYDKAGVRCLWLLRDAGFPVNAGLAAAYLAHHPSVGYSALIPSATISASKRSPNRQTDWAQCVCLDVLIRAAFRGALWFGTVREGQPAIVRLDGGFTKCASCGEWTNLGCAIEIISPYAESTFALYRLDQIPAHLLGELLPKDLASFKVGEIRKRYYRPSRTSAILNSCSACKAVIGSESVAELDGRLQPVTQFPIQVSKQLAAATALLGAARWRVSLPE